MKYKPLLKETLARNDILIANTKQLNQKALNGGQVSQEVTQHRDMPIKISNIIDTQ